MRKTAYLKRKVSCLSFLLMIFVNGCQVDAVDQSQQLFYDAETKNVFNLDNQNQLTQLIKKIADEGNEIEVIGEVSFTELMSKQGNFKAIIAKYRVGDYVTNMVVPLALQRTDNSSLKSSEGMYYTMSGCTMKCTSAWGCSECSQTIHEQCVSQTCSCTSGSGGCSSKITFHNQ